MKKCLVIYEKCFGAKTAKLIQIKHVKSINCGGNHSVIVTMFGEIYGWGKNNYGQLGLGHQIEQKIPQQINLNHKYY